MANSITRQGVKNHTLLAGDTSEYPGEYRVNQRFAEEESKAVETTLYVRHGLLVSFGAKNPNLDEAKALLDSFESSWTEWQEEYKQCIGAVSGLESSKLDLEKRRPSSGLQLNTLVLDCPLLVISDGESRLETRLGVAVCTGEARSKVWSRVTVARDADGVAHRVEMKDVESLCGRFRAIADQSIEWGFKKLRETATGPLPGSEVESQGTLRITSLGIRDEYLALAFERLLEQGTTVAGLLQDDRKLDRKLTSYCQSISSICESRMLSSYTKGSNGTRGRTHGVLWFKMPLCAVLEDGDVVHRPVLYLMRDTEDGSEVIGLAYDDSETGDLTLRSGAALVKVIGPWI